MKHLFLLFACAMLVQACNSSSNNTMEEPTDTPPPVEESPYPAALQQVFDAHGGMSLWQQQKTLSYKLDQEFQQFDLHQRKAFIKSENYMLGYDGTNAWLVEQDSGSYEGMPDLYHNLYFYFYAMPFVLGDPGIFYEPTTPISFEGVDYPGFKIDYEQGNGASYNDNYFIYYHPETHQMAWLAYTFTYFSKEKSDKTSLIRYNDWEKLNDQLYLPKSITWYTTDSTGAVGEPKNTATFENATISDQALEASVFEQATYQ